VSAVRSPITTHVLDTSLGKPAANVGIVLLKQDAEGAFREIGRGRTDGDGRLASLLPPGPLERSRYRLEFAVGEYFAGQGRESLYPEVSILFEAEPADGHYHIPLLLSPFGYSTYRGS
jgi:5-hydroxyisourate hydrolase